MAADDLTAADQRRGDPERVKAFTDGVFAIIITILVLEISVPANLPDQSLREALEETGPELLAWVISFLVTGMYWIWHRDLLAQIRYVNRDVVWLNLLFMLPAALIPFAASVLGAYHDEPPTKYGCPRSTELCREVRGGAWSPSVVACALRRACVTLRLLSVDLERSILCRQWVARTSTA